MRLNQVCGLKVMRLGLSIRSILSPKGIIQIWPSVERSDTDGMQIKAECFRQESSWRNIDDSCRNF